MSNELKPEDVGKMLIAEAMSYIGVRELGANKGAWVEEFQRAVDDKAISESWCMAFAQYVCGKVCKKLGIKTCSTLASTARLCSTTRIKST